MNLETIELGPERWARVEDLFEKAAFLDADEQRDYLDEECADDIELRDYVLALLGADRSDELSIQETIVEAVSAAFGEDGEVVDEELRGELIGPYRIERLLGSGGMGMVYLATRADEQFDQQVAIKLGRHRLVDPQTELRLKSERQILANLDHPNIARLFDGGSTSDGVPYLVMEYIDGVRIDDYCDRQRLDVPERLRLFQTICGAVHYAHQNLVIHRDIKPSNILVTHDGTPKLLDFGIAKLTDTQGAATAGLTRVGAVIMTPENAAPEQVAGRTVTTATDTYGLGLLLYQLLTGMRTHEMGDMTAGEFAHVVCTIDPVRPSQRLVQAAQAAKRSGDQSELRNIERITTDRCTSVDRLRRRLQGDLDTIVLNALRKEPERRYRSVNALADDIELHLDKRPIVARSDSWRYRTGKFLRRHYAAVAVSTIIVSMLIAFAIVASLQNQQITKERDAARQIARYLEDIFLAADPDQARGRTVTAVELLDTGASRIQSDLGSSPEIQAALMGTIGRAYFNLGETRPSIEMLEKSLALLVEIHGPDQPAVADASNQLASSYILTADYERARALLASALAINTATSGPQSLAVAGTRQNMAELYLARGELDNAEESVNRAIAIYERLAEGEGRQFADMKGLLARIMQQVGDFDRTESALTEAIEILENSEGGSHPSMAYYLQNLGVLQHSKGDYDAAERSLAQAVEATRRIFGDKHYLLAATLVDQGTLLHARGDYESARVSIHEALSLYIEIRGPEHPSVGYTKIHLGILLHDMGELGPAETELLDALRIYEQIEARNLQYTASVLTELGAVLNTGGRPVEARPLLERAMEIRQKLPPGHELVAATRTEYADNLTRLGRLEEAGPLLYESYAVLRDKPGRRRDRVEAAIERHASATEDAAP